MRGLDFSKYSDGLIPTIVQHAHSGKVLMLGFSSKESIQKTKELNQATFFSRSKNRIWTKGETSGDFLEMAAIKSDCDHDSLLFLCVPTGNTCHTGQESCFFEGDITKTHAEVLFGLYNTIIDRKQTMPKGSYVASLFAEGKDRIIQKVGEEAIETVIAAKNDNAEEFIGEFSDLLFHMMVLLSEKDIPLERIIQKLQSRMK